MKPEKSKKKCGRDVWDCIEGDSIYVECRKPGKWTKFRRTGQHQGHSCTAKKDAKATLLRFYTNIKQPT